MSIDNFPIDLSRVDIDSYTEEQAKVITSIFDDMLVVNAFAGSGKTHTLVGFCEARPTAKILYLAYNSSIKKEAISKFKHLPNVTVKTTHGLAYAQYINRYKDRLDKNGMNLTTRDYANFCDDVEEDNRYAYGSVLSSLIKDFTYSAFTMEEYIIELENKEREFEDKFRMKIDYFLSKLEEVWDEILEDESLAFEHDFYLKLFQLDNPYLENFNFIIVDEFQDSNDCVTDIVLQQTRSKKVFIGDSYQAIYQWRGASNAITKMAERPGAVSLYLTQSFRCSQQIAEIADGYLQIAEAPKTFIGNSGVKDDEAGYSDFAVIARSNIQLFQYAAFETGDKKLYFVGGFNSYNFYDLLDLVKLRYKKPNDEVEIFNPFFKSFDSFEDLKEYAEKADDKEILSKIKVSVSVPSIGKEIYALKQRTVSKAEDAEIILTTAHKSKGLEWSHVYLLKGFINLVEEPINQEEINLIYVAITRAKKRLESESVLVANELIDVRIKKTKEIQKGYMPLLDYLDKVDTKKVELLI